MRLAGYSHGVDKLDYAWKALQAMTNKGLPAAAQIARTMDKAIGDLGSGTPPGGGDGGGGGGGGNGDDPTANAAVKAVIAQFMAKLGAPYQLGAEGPDKFDCSGLVYWAFKTGGYGELISDRRLLAAGYTKWFSDQGHFTRDVSTARRGDLIPFADPGARVSHIGVYLGSGRVISALVNPYGVTNHAINRLQDVHGGKLPPYGVCQVQYPGLAARSIAQHQYQAGDSAESQALIEP